MLRKQIFNNDCNTGDVMYNLNQGLGISYLSPKLGHKTVIEWNLLFFADSHHALKDIPKLRLDQILDYCKMFRQTEDIEGKQF